MKILSWKCRGLSFPSEIPNLKKLAQQQKPDIIFLVETLSNSRKLENIRVLLKFEACLSIDVEGRSGGIVMIWRKVGNCNVLNYSRNFVNIIFTDSEKGDWRLTCYYGFP